MNISGVIRELELGETFKWSMPRISRFLPYSVVPQASRLQRRTSSKFTPPSLQKDFSFVAQFLKDESTQPNLSHLGGLGIVEWGEEAPE